jgi:hypothetical protein
MRWRSSPAPSRYNQDQQGGVTILNTLLGYTRKPA